MTFWLVLLSYGRNFSQIKAKNADIALVISRLFNTDMRKIHHKAMDKLNRYWYRFIRVFFAFAILILLQSCMTVKAYQKMYVNDSEMTLAHKKIELFEINFETYREGVAGANGGKVGGGCGCN